MITADLHTHSMFSGDSDEPMRALADAALENNLSVLCITEHLDLDYPEPGYVPDMDAYSAVFNDLKSEYSGRLEMLFGIELGIMPYLTPRLRAITKAYDFDLVIGSSHLVDGEDPYYPEYFEKFGQEGGVLRYFESIPENIKAFEDFDVYGHLDYVVRYCDKKSYSPLDYRELLDGILKALVANGKGIEINTAGLRQGLAHCNPHPFILKRYRELGGEIITVGSDAHDRSAVGADFDRAASALREAGFEYYSVFRKRKAEMLPLD